MDVTLVDYLTGLPNMNYFMSLASAKKDSMTGVQQNAAILFFDLYGMRKFNSEYGFDNGNILLKSFAKLLTDLFGNTSCCRIGGDDFADIRVETNYEQYDYSSKNNILEKYTDTINYKIAIFHSMYSYIYTDNGFIHDLSKMAKRNYEYLKANNHNVDLDYFYETTD